MFWSAEQWPKIEENSKIERSKIEIMLFLGTGRRGINLHFNKGNLSIKYYQGPWKFSNIG